MAENTKIQHIEWTSGSYPTLTACYYDNVFIYRTKDDQGLSSTQSAENESIGSNVNHEAIVRADRYGGRSDNLGQPGRVAGLLLPREIGEAIPAGPRRRLLPLPCGWWGPRGGAKYKGCGRQEAASFARQLRPHPAR